MEPRYRVILPEIPPDWEHVLGEPVWNIEWIDGSGNWRKIERQENRPFSLEMYNTKMTPVIAYPYWPEKNLHPRAFHPAGAIFPLDVQNDTITLDWQGGVEAEFYLFLSRFNDGGKRSPEQFDWKRFRALLRTELKDQDVKNDPWKVDWETAAQKIVNSGFNSRYIAEKEYSDMKVTIPESGIWVSPSPFERGHYWEKGEHVILKASESVSRYVSEKGTIVFNRKTSAFFPRKTIQ